MKRIKYIAINLLLLSLGACTSFDDINTNPDTPNTVTPAMLATPLIINIESPIDDKHFVHDNFVSKQLLWGGGVEDYVYNYFGRIDFSKYASLTNARKMVELADKDEKNAYEGLALFIKSYHLFSYTMKVGDIPYSQILEGENNNLKPVFDTQEQVLAGILTDLATSAELFSNASDFAGDPVFKGDVNKWLKTVNAFRLKILMALSSKEKVGNINVKETFAALYKQGHLLESNADNFCKIFSDKANQKYPFHYTVSKQANYGIVSSVMVDFLKELKDYRLFYYAEPAKSKIDEGVNPDAWEAYIGIDPSKTFTYVGTQYTAGEYSGLNRRYSELPACEPYIFVGYAEQNFILAEAAIRGWIQSDASSFYSKGIEAAMLFTGDNTSGNDVYNHGRLITDEYIQSYLGQSSVKLSGNQEHQISQVIQQKYLASFMQLPWAAYYDYRRTGYPKLPINPESNLNSEKDKIPVRWMYPQTEYDFNTENVEAAVGRQYNGEDAVNSKMWILK
ncbi:MAG: SusD/RagB family nutrient-binding outer membrane lipoprotein [Parabacteroides sp.]|nr:SusD/RagB family nutrient-binding outer membrane lipoprotein [Parabacteroides sp.]